MLIIPRIGRTGVLKLCSEDTREECGEVPMGEETFGIVLGSNYCLVAREKGGWR